MNSRIATTATVAWTPDIKILSSFPFSLNNTCRDGTSEIKNAATASIISHIIVIKVNMLKYLKWEIQSMWMK
jgi:hypothetical protein